MKACAGDGAPEEGGCRLPPLPGVAVEAAST